MVESRRLKYNFYPAMCELARRTCARIQDIKHCAQIATKVSQPTLSRIENALWTDEYTVDLSSLRRLEKFMQTELYSEWQVTICGKSLPKEIFQTEPVREEVVSANG
jgi:hypothetical protein